MSDFTYYDLLGVSSRATEAEIKDAYKERARYYHPDVTSLTPEIAQAQLKVINEAYSILGTASKRREYDEELLARKELTIMGDLGEVVEQLLQGKFKTALEAIQDAIQRVPESDIPRGLLASAYHMRALTAYESQKYELARKMLKQALTLDFDDAELRRALRNDLAVVEHRQQAPVPLTDAETIITELGARNKHAVLRALQALSAGLFPEEAPVVSALQQAGQSPYRDVRLAALRVLVTHDPKHSKGYEALLGFYNAKKEDAKLKFLARFAGKCHSSMVGLVLPLLWEPQERVRLRAIALVAKRGKKEHVVFLAPLLWSLSKAVQRQALWAILRIRGNFGAILGFMPKPKTIKPAQNKMRDLFSGEAKLFPQVAAYWESPKKRSDILRTWAKTKTPARFLPYAMVAFYEKMAGATEGCREFLAQHGDLSIPMMIEATKDEDWMIRLGAIEVLKETKSIQAADTLLAALSDPRPLILKAAIEGLGKLGESRAVDSLRLLLRNEDPETADLAQKALNEIRGHKVPTQKKKKENGFDNWTG